MLKTLSGGRAKVIPGDTVVDLEPDVREFFRHLM